MLKLTKSNWRVWATLLATILAVIFIYWQRKAIVGSISEIKAADPFWLFVSILAHICSVLAAAAVYWQLAIKKTSFNNIFIAQTASLFTARVTPAGIGGVATLGKVLANAGHKAAELGAVISVNGMVTFLGNVSLTIFALFISGKSIASGFSIPKIIYLIPIFIISTIIIIYLVKSWRQKVIVFLSDLLKTLSLYRHKKKNIILGFFFGVLTTAGYMLALWAAGMSVGVELTILACIVTVSLGTLGASATPLPGGVVGAEATLALSMTQFGVPASQALAVAFVYRFITYWLPILPGYIMTQYALRKKVL